MAKYLFDMLLFPDSGESRVNKKPKRKYYLWYGRKDGEELAIWAFDLK